MRSAFTFLISLALSAGAPAFGEMDLARFRGQVRAGAEIELTPEQFSLIVGYFDLSSIEADAKYDRLFREMADDYLENREAFERLPAELRQRLAGDLTLAGKSRIVVPDGPVDAAKEKRAAPASEPVEKSKGGLFLTENQRVDRDWQTLTERWRALPREERVKWMSVEELPAVAKAHLALGLFRFRKQTIPLKADAPPGVRAILADYEWEAPPRQHLIEFRHRVPFDDPAAMEKSRAAFARLTNTTRGFNDLELPKDGGVAYHFHISKTGEFDEAKFEALARQYNALLLMRLAAADRLDAALSNGQVAYNEDLSMKGLVQLVSPGRLEVRAHLKEPAETLGELAELMTLKPEAAMKRMTAEIKTYENRGLLDAVAARNTDAAEGVLRAMATNREDGRDKVVAMWRRRLSSESPDLVRLNSYFQLQSRIEDTPEGDFRKRLEKVLGSSQAGLFDEGAREKLLAILGKPLEFRSPEWEQRSQLIRRLRSFVNPFTKTPPFFQSREFITALARLSNEERGRVTPATELLWELVETSPDARRHVRDFFTAGNPPPASSIDHMFTAENLKLPAFVEAAARELEGNGGARRAEEALHAYARARNAHPVLDEAFAKGFRDLPAERAEYILDKLLWQSLRGFMLEERASKLPMLFAPLITGENRKRDRTTLSLILATVDTLPERTRRRVFTDLYPLRHTPVFQALRDGRHYPYLEDSGFNDFTLRVDTCLERLRQLAF